MKYIPDHRFMCCIVLCLNLKHLSLDIGLPFTVNYGFCSDLSKAAVLLQEEELSAFKDLSVVLNKTKSDDDDMVDGSSTPRCTLFILFINHLIMFVEHYQ